MNKTSLIQQSRIKKKEQVVAYLKKAFKSFDYPVYLFGSYATGQFHGCSDVDILIISPDVLSAEIYRQACDQMTELGMNYDILISSSLDCLDDSIVNSLQIISATVPCVALPPDLTSMDGGNTARLPGAVAVMPSHDPLPQHQTGTSPFVVSAVEPYRRQFGMTLIEIMIALLIGAFLLGGVLQIFVSSKQTNRMQEGLSRLQENGRFAINFISKDIRRAGFQGCPSLRNGNVISNVIVSAPVIPALTENTLISGADSIASNWNANACGAGNVCITGTDAISVTYGESCSGNLSAAMADVNADIQILATNTCSVNATWALLVSNCSSGDIFRATNDATNAGTTIQHPALNTAYGMDSELFIYRAYTYFIRESTSGAPGRSLWRLDNTKVTSSSNPVELIEGVEDMQILYGVDIDDDDDGNTTTSAPDGPANYYVTANNIPDIDVNGTPDWYRIISIRISLLAVTLDDNLSVQPVPYTYNGATTTPTDLKIRRVFNTTIVLRNRLP